MWESPYLCGQSLQIFWSAKLPPRCCSNRAGWFRDFSASSKESTRLLKNSSASCCSRKFTGSPHNLLKRKRKKMKKKMKKLAAAVHKDVDRCQCPHMKKHRNRHAAKQKGHNKLISTTTCKSEPIFYIYIKGSNLPYTKRKICNS